MLSRRWNSVETITVILYTLFHLLLSIAAERNHFGDSEVYLKPAIQK